jgi:hypothetical protein
MKEKNKEGGKRGTRNVKRRMKITVFWDMIPWSLVDGYKHFRRTHCLFTLNMCM